MEPLEHALPQPEQVCSYLLADQILSLIKPLRLSAARGHSLASCSQGSKRSTGGWACALSAGLDRLVLSTLPSAPQQPSCQRCWPESSPVPPAPKQSRTSLQQFFTGNMLLLSKYSGPCSPPTSTGSISNTSLYFCEPLRIL